MPNSIIPSSLRYMWKNNYKSNALGQTIKIHEQDGGGSKCALAAAKSVFKFNGIDINQDIIGRLAHWRKGMGTWNFDLVQSMNFVFSYYNRDIRFIWVCLTNSLYVSTTSLRNLENYLYNVLNKKKQPIILGISGVIPNKKNIYGNSLGNHDVLLVDIIIDKFNPYKTTYHIADSNTPDIITEFTAKDFLNFNLGKSFDLIVPIDAQEYANIFPSIKENQQKYAKNIADSITQTNSIYDEKQKFLLQQLKNKAFKRFYFLETWEGDFKKQEINLNVFIDKKIQFYDDLKHELELIINDYIDDIKIISPELQNLLNKKINQRQNNYEYLKQLEENKFASVPVLMDTKFLVDHFKKTIELWDPFNIENVLYPNLDLITVFKSTDILKSKFYLQNQDKIDEIVKNFDLKQTSIPLTRKTINFKLSTETVGNFGKQLAFFSLIKFFLEDNSKKSIKDIGIDIAKLAEQIGITETIEGAINFSSSSFLAKSLVYHTIIGAVANGIASGIITAEEGKDAREILNNIAENGAGALAYIATTAGVTMLIAGPVGELIAIPVALLVSTFTSLGIEKILNNFEKNFTPQIFNFYIQNDDLLEFYEDIYDIEKMSLQELKDKIKNILAIYQWRIKNEVNSTKRKIFYYKFQYGIVFEEDFELKIVLLNEQIKNIITELNQLFSYINNIIDSNLSSEEKGIIYNQYSNKLNEFIQKFSLKIGYTKIEQIIYETLKKIHSLLLLFQNYVLTDKLLESYVTELENHKSVDWELNLHNVISFLTKEIKKYESYLINSDLYYKTKYLERSRSLNTDNNQEKDENSLIIFSKVKEFFMKDAKITILFKILSNEEINRENHIKNLILFNKILENKNNIDFSDNLNLFNNLSTHFIEKFHSNVLDLRTRTNNYFASSPEQQKNAEWFKESLISLYKDTNNRMVPLVLYKKISKYFNLIINISKNINKNFEELKEELEGKLCIFYFDELANDYDYYSKKIRTSLSELQNREKEPEKYKENDFFNNASINSYLQELEFLNNKKEKIIKDYNFTYLASLHSLDQSGLLKLLIINNLILNTKEIINNLVNFFQHDKNLDKTINKKLKKEDKKRTLLIEQLNLMNNKDDKSKNRIDYLNHILQSYFFIEKHAENKKEKKYHKNIIKEFWKNEKIYNSAKEIINNNFNNQFFLQVKNHFLIPFALSKFLDWLNEQKDNPEVNGFVTIVKKHIKRKIDFYTTLETLKLNVFNKSFDYQNIINKLEIFNDDKESLKHLYKNIQELDENYNRYSKTTIQNKNDLTFKHDNFSTEFSVDIEKTRKWKKAIIWWMRKNNIKNN